MKGRDGSNPSLSGKQSVFFVYILEKAETPREMRRSFSPQRTGERRPRPDSPDSASILSMRGKNGSLQRRDAPLGGCSPHHRSPISLERFRDSAVLAGCAGANGLRRVSTCRLLACARCVPPNRLLGATLLVFKHSQIEIREKA